MVYEEKPIDFIPDMEVVGCLVECDNKILLLLRQDNKREGNKWGLPGGKIEKMDDYIEEAIIREIREETGLIINKSELTFHKKFFITHLSFSFFYHYFNLKFKKIPNIIISENEHKEFAWMTKEEALNKQLVADEDYCIKDYYGIK